MEAAARRARLIDAAHDADPSRAADGRAAELAYADRMEALGRPDRARRGRHAASRKPDASTWNAGGFRAARSPPGSPGTSHGAVPLL